MQQLKTGILYTAIGRYSNVVLSIVISAVLSRILSPDNYGVVAILQIFIFFFALLVDAGLGPAIIQNKTLTQEDTKILFNYSIIFAIFLSVLFGFAGRFISVFYQNPVFITLAWVQSLSVLFNGLNVVPTAILNKNKRFKEISLNSVISNIAGGIVGISLAFLGARYYALIASAITVSFIGFVLNRHRANISISKSMNLTPLKQVWNFARNQLGFNFINYFSRNSDNILIGRYMGNAALGYYSKAYKLLLMPNNILLSIITPVLQPVLSDYQDDVSKIREIYYKIVHILALIGIPLSVFLSLASQQIIFFLYGPQWGDAVEPFTILALTVWVQMTLSSTGGIYQARNQTNLLLINGIVSATIIVASIIVGVFLGTINFVAITLSVGFVINFFVSFTILTKLTLKSNLFIFMKEFINPFILGMLVFVTQKLVGIIHIDILFLELLIRGSVFAIALISFIMLTKEKELLKMVIGKKR